MGPSRTRRAPILWFLLLLALTPGCSRDRALQPRTGTGLSFEITTAPRGAAEPAFGPVDTVRIVVRDADGARLTALSIPVAAGQRTFQAALDVPVGVGRSVTVLALGRRALLGGPEELPASDRGVLFRERVDNVSVEAGRATPLAVVLRGFVPTLQEPALLTGQAHRVRWNRVPGAVRYELRRYFDGEWIAHSVTDTLFEADGLPSSYLVRAFEAGGAAGALSDYGLATLPPPPAVPAGLSATGASATRIDLAWDASEGSGPITYDVERRVDPSPEFASLGAGLVDTVFSDTGVDIDHAYHYRVRAVGRGGASDWSNEAVGTALPPLPGAPTGLTATATSSTHVTLGWTPGSGPVAGYDLLRRVPPAAFALLAALPGDATTHDDLSVTERTTYEYRLVPRNAAGPGPGSNTAAVTTPPTPPAAPTNVSAHAVAPTQIDLTWTDNSSFETGFEVQRAPAGGGAFVTLVTTLANITSFLDQGVFEKTGYRYRVRALVEGATSEWSPEVTATTPASLPAPPSGLAALAITPHVIRLTWIDNASNEDSMRVERQNDSDGWDAVRSLPANSTTTDMGGLVPETSYSFRLRTINAAGLSDPSNVASATTPADIPNAPSGLTGSAPQYNRVTLQWVDTSDNETSFDILRQVGTTGVLLSAPANAEAYTDTTVGGSTAYLYSVRARNGTATSDYTGPVRVTTPLGPPGAPVNLIATASGSRQVNLTWTAAAGVVSFYDIESRVAPAAFAPLVTVASPSGSYPVLNLEPSTTYEFRVKARNSVGSSPFSNVATATTAQSLPDAPSGLTGDPTGATTVQLSWTDNATNEDSFEVQGRILPTGSFVPLAHPVVDAVGAALTGLLPNTGYEFRVRAVNSLGPSAWSNTTLVTTLDLEPATPEALNATATSSTRVDLSWQPGSGGGAPLDFRIERRVSGGSFVEIATASAQQLDYGDQGVAPVTTYEYRLRARNSAGYSGYSNIDTVTTPLELPGVPGGVTVSPPVSASTQISLVWNPASGTVEFYDIQYRRVGAAAWLAGGSVAGGTLDYTQSGLAPQTNYEFQVRSRNSAGGSGWSTPAQGTTWPLPPEAPTDLVADLDPNYQVHLYWRDDSSRETRFELERSVNTGPLSWGTLGSTGANVTSFSDPNADSPVPYVYRVRACNLAGCSDWSDTLGVITTMPFPAPPTDFRPNPLSATTIELLWTDNGTFETGYEIERVAATGTAVVPVGADVTAIGDNGLSPALVYSYRIRALSAFGNSPWVGPIQATTAASGPGAPTNVTAELGGHDQIVLRWDSGALNEQGFQIIRVVGSSFLVGTAGINATHFDYNGVAPGTYQLYVRAYNGAGGNGSATVTITVP